MTLTSTPTKDTNCPVPPSTIHALAGPGLFQYLNPTASPDGPPPAATTMNKMIRPRSMESLREEKANSASPEFPTGR